MPSYKAPVRDTLFVLNEVLQIQQYRALPGFNEATPDLISAILIEGAKFTETVLQPLNLSGDEIGCTRHADGSVDAPPGFKQAYQQFNEGGWGGLSADPAYGGQGLPHVISTAFEEYLISANMAFTMYPGLTFGAIAAITAVGSAEQKQRYIPNMVAGTWTGTMNLTEPHCGTDLGLLRTKAELQPDGTCRITGTKIFISAGEHNLSENIIHLVLAKMTDSPDTVKGISLFIVPKFLVNADGTLGARNAVSCGSIEQKMGIHGNATCVMNLDGARGWLIGEPHKGLAAMFVMMNSSRLGVGMQSLGLAEVSLQNAVAYARDRVQGRSSTGVKQPDKPADSIMVHPDVRRMLLTCKAYTEGGRAMTTWTALLTDRGQAHPDPAIRAEAKGLVAFLTPVVKAFITDNAFETSNLALQVYGGYGFIRESGMEQYVRDARINMIYEGTNGIQALDLLGRKVLHDQGAKLRLFGSLVKDFVTAQSDQPEMQEFIVPLAKLGEQVGALSTELARKVLSNPDEIGAASVPYLRVVGHLVYAWLWARMARVALDKLDSGDDFYKAKLATARFYFSKLLPETAYQLQAARAGAGPLMELEAELF